MMTKNQALIEVSKLVNELESVGDIKGYGLIEIKKKISDLLDIEDIEYLKENGY